MSSQAESPSTVFGGCEDPDLYKYRYRGWNERQWQTVFNEFGFEGEKSMPELFVINRRWVEDKKGSPAEAKVLKKNTIRSLWSVPFSRIAIKREAD